MVESLQRIKDYCTFGEDRAYMLMAIARKKENESLSSSEEIVFREVVKDEEDIERKIGKLKSACKNYGDYKFRLYMSVNARNTMDAYFNFRSTMNEWVQERFSGHDESKRKFKRVDSHWKSQLQKPSSRDETFFLWDLDDETAEIKQGFVAGLEDYTDVLLDIETPNGYHVVTDTFDYTRHGFSEEYELKTDGMMFLEVL